MQLVLNLKTVLILAVLGVGGYFAYQTFLAETKVEDVAELIEMHRTAPELRRDRIARAVVRNYDRTRDYPRVLSALEHHSPVTQALAVRVLAAKWETGAAPKFRAMLANPATAPRVTVELAKALARFPPDNTTGDVVERLIELTDDAQPGEVRQAAHAALGKILRPPPRLIHFGDGVRTQWTEYWRNERRSFR